MSKELDLTNEIKTRILKKDLWDKVVSAETAADLLMDGMTVSMSGFTPTGYPKVVPLAVAERVKKGEKMKFDLHTGASIGPEVDDVWSKNGMVRSRLPYQTNDSMRKSINKGEVDYIDIHLSQVTRGIYNGVLDEADIAIIEAIAIDENGDLVPPAAIGNAAEFVAHADGIIIELNITRPIDMWGMADIPLHCTGHMPESINIKSPGDRIGGTVIPCDDDKIKAIVISTATDQTRHLGKIDQVTGKISEHIVDFLKAEVKKGRLPEDLRPLQSGVGSIANAVFAGLYESGFTNLKCYTEVIQDSMLDLIRSGKISVASATAVSPSPEALIDFEKDIKMFKDKIILRPQSISNSPEVISRLNVISINTALEMDIYGNVNSTHVMGKMMNGIGGSGDFARNAGLSIFASPSIVKNGDISNIVPMVSHVDHSEHDVMVVVTEEGLADLRGLSPRQKAMEIINNCANPIYRDDLKEYFDEACASAEGQTPHIFNEALSWHDRYLKTGTMKV